MPGCRNCTVLSHNFCLQNPNPFNFSFSFSYHLSSHTVDSAFSSLTSPISTTMCTTTTLLITSRRRRPLNPSAAAFTPPNKINSPPPQQQPALITTAVIPSKSNQTHFPTTNTKLIYYTTLYPYNNSSYPYSRLPYHHHIPSSPHPLYGLCFPLRFPPPPPLLSSKGSADVFVDDAAIKDGVDKEKKVEKWRGDGEREEVRVSRRQRRLYPTPPRMWRSRVVDDDGAEGRRRGKARGWGRDSRGHVGGDGGGEGGFGYRLEWRERKKINSSIGEGNSTTATTTVMIRNIPNKLSRGELIELVGEHCKKANQAAEKADDDDRSEFDFLYLPFCFRRLGNRGYAFVNFTAAAAASRFCESWNGLQWAEHTFSSKKVVVVTQAMIQGKQELKKHFQTTVFRCNNDEFLPVELTPPNDGSRSFELINIGTRCATKSPLADPLP
ncbi:hypothetical protein Droror1_Dr00004763 [Drosera rotundifolia]